MAKISLNVLPYETYTPPLPGIVATALLIITNSFKLSSYPSGYLALYTVVKTNTWSLYG